MDLRSMMISKDTKLNEFTQTSQYRLSRVLMRERYKTSLSVHEIANLLNLTLDEYANLEFGDTSISNEDYKKYINILIENNLKNTPILQVKPNFFGKNWTSYSISNNYSRNSEVGQYSKTNMDELGLAV